MSLSVQSNEVVAPPRSVWWTLFWQAVALMLIASVAQAILGLLRLQVAPWVFWAVLALETIGLYVILSAGKRRGNRFRRQVAEGAFAVLVMAVTFAPTTWMVLTFVTPDYADQVVEHAREIWDSSGVEEAQIGRLSAQLREQYVPHKQAMYVVGGTLMTLLPVVIILASAVRSRADRSDHSDRDRQ